MTETFRCRLLIRRVPACRSLKKKSNKTNIGGLVPSWVPPNPIRLASHKAVPGNAGNTDVLGGISDDEDGDNEREREALTLRSAPVQYYGGSSAVKTPPVSLFLLPFAALKIFPGQVRSVAKIIPNTTTPGLVTSRARAAPGQIKKESITLNHLPAGSRDTFRTIYVPLLREFAGLLGPWQQPVDEDIREIWTYSFKGGIAPELDKNVLWVLNKLVCSRNALKSSFRLILS